MTEFLPRPFLKWAGGKTQLLYELVSHLPPFFKDYYEPFVGSGALFFRLYRDGKLHGGFLSDQNAELIDTYQAVCEDPDAVIRLLSGYAHSRDFYYSVRAEDPGQLDLPTRAARMIYLNKTGYNGLYRVNRHGQFNVPFGRHRSPTLGDPANLRAVSQALQKVTLSCASFDRVVEQALPGDLVYFDPPYAPQSATAYFTAYQAGGFSSDDQRRLRDVCLELATHGVYVMLSNSDTEFVRALYEAPCFRHHQVWAKRAINSKVQGRGRVPELIVTSYAF